MGQQYFLLCVVFILKMHLKNSMSKIKKFLSQIRSILLKVVLFFKEHTIARNFLVFGVFFAISSLVYLTILTISSSDDHYFHIRFAEKLLNEGFLKSFYNFDSIYFTKIREGVHFIYYNFLFYITLLPFTFFDPLYLGIKLYAIFATSILSFVVYLVLKNLNIKYPFLWSLGMFAIIGISSFWRFFLSRPFVLAPIFLLGILYFLHKKNYKWTLVLSFLYLFWHTATFWMPIVIAFIYFIMHILYFNKKDYRILIFPIVGTVLALFLVMIIDNGFFVHIYNNIVLVIKNIIFGNEINIPEGNELYKKNIFDYIQNNLLLFIMYIFSLIIFLARYFKERKDIKILGEDVKNNRVLTFTLFFFSSLLLLAISNVSNRFNDFFVIFGFIFLVFVINYEFGFIKFENVFSLKSTKTAILGVLIFIVFSNMVNLHGLFSEGSYPETFLEVGTYLNQNVPEGEIVFDTNWSWFTQLYYYAPNQNYVIGLEPKLTYLYDQRIYFLWFHIGGGYVCEVEICEDKVNAIKNAFDDEKTKAIWAKEEGDKIADALLNDFKSSYIVTSREYETLTEILKQNERFELLTSPYGYYFLYKVK